VQTKSEQDWNEAPFAVDVLLTGQPLSKSASTSIYPAAWSTQGDRQRLSNQSELGLTFAVA
jgi:hypothetical protein